MTDAERTRLWRQNNQARIKAYYEANKERIRARNRQRYHDKKEHCKQIDRLKWIRTINDPDRYAMMLERRREWYSRNKDRINRKRRTFRQHHRSRFRKYARWYSDRKKALFARFPELYAEHRARYRIYNARCRRRRKPSMMAYKPKLSMRIPDYCSYARTFDKRSVYVWNNLPAESLRAGRAYWRMQCRERYGDDR